MITNSIKELRAAQSKVAALEAAISAERNAALASLPAEYGYDDVNAFIAAVRSSTGKKRGRKPGKTPKVGLTSSRKKGTRARITDDIRAEVKKLLVEGKTGKEVSTAVGISLPSVQNIKSALGMVTKRK